MSSFSFLFFRLFTSFLTSLAFATSFHPPHCFSPSSLLFSLFPPSLSFSFCPLPLLRLSSLALSSLAFCSFPLSSLFYCLHHVSFSPILLSFTMPLIICLIFLLCLGPPLSLNQKVTSLQLESQLKILTKWEFISVLTACVYSFFYWWFAIMWL